MRREQAVEEVCWLGGAMGFGCGIIWTGLDEAFNRLGHTGPPVATQRIERVWLMLG